MQRTGNLAAFPQLQRRGHMKRRELIALIGSATVDTPFRAPAQQSAGVRRVGVLIGREETNPFTIENVEEFRGALQTLGWTDNQNIQLTYRYASGDPKLARVFAKELVEMRLDLIV